MHSLNLPRLRSCIGRLRAREPSDSLGGVCSEICGVRTGTRTQFFQVFGIIRPANLNLDSIAADVGDSVSAAVVVDARLCAGHGAGLGMSDRTSGYAQDESEKSFHDMSLPKI